MLSEAYTSRGPVISPSSLCPPSPLPRMRCCTMVEMPTGVGDSFRGQTYSFFSLPTSAAARSLASSCGGRARGARGGVSVYEDGSVRRGLWCAGASLAAVYMPFLMPMGSRRVCHMNSMKMAGSPQARGQRARNGHFPQVRMRYG